MYEKNQSINVSMHMLIYVIEYYEINFHYLKLYLYHVNINMCLFISVYI